MASIHANGGTTVRGAYTADRAAALAGVPRSTVYYWARKAIYLPTLSRGRVMLWSWPDLLALRAIYWLRATKPQLQIRPTPMNKVRHFLESLEVDFGARLGEHLDRKSLVLRVDSAGNLYVGLEEALVHPVSVSALQVAFSDEMIDLLAEYEPGQGIHGPHLINPRPKLRIVPGKLGGEPHVRDTRIETRTINALIRRKYDTSEILGFYPFLDAESVSQAVDLEDQLGRNLARSAA